MNNTAFSDWFCLRGDRKNFTIDPVLDRDRLFGMPEWESAIDDRLRKCQLLGMPLRLVWWGQFGIGKTHRLRHTEHLIHSHEYAYRPCYVIASDIQEKTGFETLHFELVNHLGREEMRSLVKAYVFKAAMPGSGVLPLKEICGGSTDVNSAMESFGAPAEKLVQVAWRFLCGLELDKGESDMIGTTRHCLERASDFAAVIGAFATIIESETKKQLLYLVDEGENLLRITNRTAEAQWNEALRALLDLKNLSIVMTVGAEKSDKIPVLVLQPDIVRRIQKDNYVQMESFKAPEARSFVGGLLKAWVDPDRLAALESKEGFRETVKDYDPAFYPFTPGSFEMFCEAVILDPRNAKPSEILAKLNNVAADAYFKQKRMISKDQLSDLGF